VIHGSNTDRENYFTGEGENILVKTGKTMILTYSAMGIALNVYKREKRNAA